MSLSILFIITAVGIAGLGFGLLPRNSERHKKIQFIINGFFSMAVLLSSLLFLAHFPSVSGEGSLFFISPAVEIFSHMGKYLFNEAVTPPVSIRIVLISIIIIGDFLLIIRDRQSFWKEVLSWSAVGIGLASVTFWGKFNPMMYWTLCGLSIIFFLWSDRRNREIFIPSYKLKKRTVIICLGIIILLGFILRFYQLDINPPSLLDYEGTTGLSGIEVIEGKRDYHLILWSFIARPIMNCYSVPFFAFPLALFFRIFGISILTLRSLSAFWGIITIAAIYGLVRQRESSLLALLVAFFMAVSSWHIVISRVGMSLSLTPLYAVVIGWALLKAFETGRLRYYFISGLGLGSYWLFYMISKVLLLTGGLIILQKIFLSRGFLKRHWSGLLVILLVILLISILSGLGPKEWLLGAGKQSNNFIWQRQGPQSTYTPRINYYWTARYLLENIKKSFRYLFLYSHHEFLLPSKLPFISPLLFPFFLMGLFYSMFRWKQDLNLFFVSLFLISFIPQIIFATFQDKASIRHLMLLIPSFSYFTALPFYLLAQRLLQWKNPSGRIAVGIVIIPLLIVFLTVSFYITFLTPHWEYLVCRMRRHCAEFILNHLDRYYFFVIRGRFPLYLQNRIIDFITYPKVQSLHYHLTDNYPQAGTPGIGVSKNYAYIQVGELPTILNLVEKDIPRAGFVFEDADLVPIFEERFGKGIVKEHNQYSPWVYYSVLLPSE